MTTNCVNLVSRAPQLLLHVMVCCVTYAPSLEMRTCSATVYVAKMVHVPSRISR